MKSSTLPHQFFETAAEAGAGISSILSPKELAKYPSELDKSIRSIADGGRPTGLVLACHRVLEEQFPNLRSDDRSLLVPIGGLKTRALDPATLAGGGALVGTDIDRNIANALRPYNISITEGARVVSTQRSNYQIGREAAEATFAWYHQQDTVTESSNTFRALSLTPKRCAALVNVSKQLRYSD